MTNGVVIVQGDKIIEAGSGAPIPQGARVVDLGDATLSPGFMDAHTHLSEMFRNAVKIGVKIAFGTDAAVFPHGQNAKEFALMTGLGMAPIDALRSATSVTAELFGISEKVGTLKNGKLAGIIAMPTSPRPSAFPL